MWPTIESPGRLYLHQRWRWHPITLCKKWVLSKKRWTVSTGPITQHRHLALTPEEQPRIKLSLNRVEEVCSQQPKKKATLATASRRPDNHPTFARPQNLIGGVDEVLAPTKSS